jgi:hypothetical protein
MMQGDIVATKGLPHWSAVIVQVPGTSPSLDVALNLIGVEHQPLPDTKARNLTVVSHPSQPFHRHVQLLGSLPQRVQERGSWNLSARLWLRFIPGGGLLILHVTHRVLGLVQRLFVHLSSPFRTFPSS